MYFSNSQILKHALATPVTTILLNLELALACEPGDLVFKSNFSHYLNRAFLSAKYLKSILKESGNQKASFYQSFFLKQAINEVSIIAKKSSCTSQLINYLSIDDQLLIKGSKIYFQEAMICLLNNAFESYQDNVANKLVVLSARKKDKEVEINITDAGQGMNWLRQKMAVIPGVSMKKKHQGLGLAFAKKLITQKMTGKFYINSKANKGTRIRLLLPLVS